MHYHAVFTLLQTAPQSGSCVSVGFWMLIIGVIFGVILHRRLASNPKADGSPFIECPHCSEPVRRGAAVCRSCHRTLGKAAT